MALKRTIISFNFYFSLISLGLLAFQSSLEKGCGVFVLFYCCWLTDGDVCSTGSCLGTSSNFGISPTNSTTVSSGTGAASSSDNSSEVSLVADASSSSSSVFLPFFFDFLSFLSLW